MTDERAEFRVAGMSSPPDAARWARVKARFEEARLQPTDLRAGWVERSEGDDEVRREVLRLLQADSAVGDRFERGAWVYLPPASIADLDTGDEPPPPTLVGRRLGPYDVVRRVGEGGMGTVYEAVRADENYRERVAIKTVWRGVDSVLLARRLRSERQILASLRHPHIAALLDGGTTPEGLPYLVMEYVDGAPIDAWCDARRLPINARLDLFRRVCAAVAHAHRNLVVHRDLKPSNVLVTDDGAVKLLDFGVAKLLDAADGNTGPGTLTGAGVSPFTAAYAAPEQVGGGTVSTATDVYALGALLHTLLTGQPPLDVRGMSTADALLAVRDAVRRTPSDVAIPDDVAQRRGIASGERLTKRLRGELDAIVAMALRPEPGRRYRSVEALDDDVLRYLRGDRVIARPDSAGYRVRTLVRRRPAAATAVAALVLTLTAGVASTWWNARKLRAEAALTARTAEFLAGMAGGADVHFGNPFARLGPRATIAELLDSAAARVPLLFADEPRVRARLYTAIGASYTAQMRLDRAAAVLDSARRLAWLTEGPQSALYAEATINATNAAFHYQPLGATIALSDTAIAALPIDAATTQLRERALIARGSALLHYGHAVRAESLFAEADSLEARRSTAPSLARSWVLAMRALERYFAGDPVNEIRLAHRSYAVAESAGGGRSVERLQAQWVLSTAFANTGRGDSARYYAQQLRDGARSTFGDHSREDAMGMIALALSEMPSGDVARARRFADSAWRIVDSLPALNASVISSAAYVASGTRILVGDYEGALGILERAAIRVTPLETPYADAVVQQTIGIAHILAGRPAAAEAPLRRAIAVTEPLPALAGVRDASRAQWARVVRALGRPREADSVAALLPASLVGLTRIPIAPLKAVQKAVPQTKTGR